MLTTTKKASWHRFSKLGSKIHNKQATLEEKQEYMELALDLGVISDVEYNEFIAALEKNDTADDLIKAVLVVGVLAVLTYIFTRD